MNNRIQMNIPAQLKNVTVLIDNRCQKTPLHEMAAAAVSPIVVHGISCLKTLHKTTEIGAWRFQYKMRVIEHEAVKI